MTRIIIQVTHTFIVDAEKTQEATRWVLDSIKVEPTPGVQPVGRKVSALDPFEDHAGDII